MHPKHEKEIHVLSPLNLFTVLSSWAFLVAGMGRFREKQWPVFFWAVCAAVSTWPLVRPGTTILMKGTRKYRLYLQQAEAERRADKGIFSYTADGFTVMIGEQEHCVCWSDIKILYGYVFSTAVCLDAVTKAGDIFTFSEGTDGWYVLQRELAAHFPIAANWDEQITGGSIISSLTCLYETEYDKTTAGYYYSGRKEASINPDHYPPYGGEYYSRLPE